jgi:hypothetical protein
MWLRGRALRRRHLVVGRRRYRWWCRGLGRRRLGGDGFLRLALRRIGVGLGSGLERQREEHRQGDEMPTATVPHHDAELWQTGRAFQGRRWRRARSGW